jgi:phosphatidylglycerophosphatase A
MGQPILDRAAIFIATGFGAGFSPVVPGTVGALWGLPVVYGVFCLPGLAFQLGAIVVLFVICAPICERAALALGGKKDPGAIVLDEIASLPIVFLGVAPLSLGIPDYSAADWRVYAAGFLLHRVFDIAKPPPIGQAERLPGGWGIMADDTAAAIAAAIVLWGLGYLGLFN